MTFACSRAAGAAFALLAVSVLTFALTSLAPGDPAEELLRRGGIQPTQASVTALRAELGLDRPLAVQYLHWLGGVLRGDFGRSYADGTPVAPQILSRAPATLRLAGVGFLIALVLAVVMAVRAQTRPHAALGRITRALTLAVAAVPPYVLGILLISVLAVEVRIFPTGGDTTAEGLVLPGLTLGIATAAPLMRLLRSDLAAVHGSPFMALALAKGLTVRRATLFHALPAAAPAAISAAGVALTEVAGGAVVVETLFNWPGVGQLAVTAVRQRDIPIVQGYVLFAAAATVLVLALADACVTLMDPRLRDKTR
ncbi:ABC transporter permease [Actinomadura sp. HBU206391]|uniref:ABC transporter permease n=1 Tax=Actinomadura sp. HBU206391 TaxID=2731692 RepID=UPI00164F6AA4|nr:ABC transporter permease [Actinomadura sp. HBU206391]MBC6458921.1 ABC transporter permease [Actinomadura sp. HBU206391]